MGRLRRFGQHWDALGETDPFGSILTGIDFSRWNIEEFFSIGHADVNGLMTDLVRLMPFVPRRSALDFGCGVGRLTRALAEHFDSVMGVDVAPSMIRRARALNTDYPRCRFLRNRPSHLKRFATGQFDLVFSRLVLQHIPPRLLRRRYIPELVRVTAPGGALVFQLPGVVAPDSEEAFRTAAVAGSPLKRCLPRGIVSAFRAAKYRFLVDESVPRMLMFVMDRDEVISLIHRGGGRIVTIRPDQSPGTDVAGFEYWVSK